MDEQNPDRQNAAFLLQLERSVAALATDSNILAMASTATHFAIPASAATGFCLDLLRWGVVLTADGAIAHLMGELREGQDDPNSTLNMSREYRSRPDGYQGKHRRV